MARRKQNVSYADIPAKDRAEVKAMVGNFTTTPQIAYMVLRERREKDAAKVEDAARKEAATLALLRSGILNDRRNDLGSGLLNIDALAEMLESRLDQESNDDVAQCGIRVLREQIKKVENGLDNLFDPPPVESEDEEAEHV